MSTFLLSCTLTLLLFQFVYLSCQQFSRNFVSNPLVWAPKIQRQFQFEFPRAAFAFQLRYKKVLSGSAARQSPLIKPIQLDDQLNYPLYAVFNDEKIEQLSLASHTNSFGQFEKKYERFSISMLSPSPQIKKEENYHSLILKASHRHALDPALIKAIIMAESGFNPKAISKKGAKGLMQLMPKTAKAMGVKDVFDPEQNIEGGVRYFKKLLTTFKGDIKLALAAYNAGSRKVKEYKGIPPYNVTKYYIKKVIKFRKKYSRQMAEDASDV